ncbi:hypothetical protein BWD12_04305 [Leptospira santarosai serovar Bananal]|nr:hypothetical protein BWD12_04305 [Leptospira santarosai serovar Bananal]
MRLKNFIILKYRSRIKIDVLSKDKIFSKLILVKKYFLMEFAIVRTIVKDAADQNRFVFLRITTYYSDV